MFLFIFQVGSFASIFAFFLCIIISLQAEILSRGSFLEQTHKIMYPDKIRGLTLIPYCDD